LLHFTRKTRDIHCTVWRFETEVNGSCPSTADESATIIHRQRLVGRKTTDETLPLTERRSANKRNPRCHVLARTPTAASVPHRLMPFLSIAPQWCVPGRGTDTPKARVDGRPLDRFTPVLFSPDPPHSSSLRREGGEFPRLLVPHNPPTPFSQRPQGAS
jgi:hypothetical protein